MTRAGRAMVVALALACAIGAAESASKPAPPPPPPPPPPVDLPPPVYEPQLLRLSEIIGALAFLRDICGAGDAEAYRAKMAALLDVEAKTTEQRQRLAGAYNRGFRDYERNYNQCTPSAEEATRRFLDEAARLSSDIATRYGG